MFEARSTLNCKGNILDLSNPIVMGILNVTPDSFFDGGKYNEATLMLQQVERMLKDGATIIDVGGMSSRPGAEIISVEKELTRVIPVIEQVRQTFPKTVISIDTIRSKVAKEAIEAGASIINDISGGKFDPNLHNTVADLEVPYILMHMQGKPEDMQQAPVYDDLVNDILDFFIQQIGKLRSMGVNDIIIDPGFGFGKTIDHNYLLLKKLEIFKMLEVPILIGVSRKSMIYKMLDISSEEALNGTTALNMIALQKGAKILRVHDVKEAVQTIKIWKKIADM